MGTFRINEGQLEVPEGWEDRSVTALSFPAKSQKPEASFAITRDSSLTEGTTLSAYVDRQMVDMAKTCPRFEVLSRVGLDIDGNPAESLLIAWRSPDGSFVQQEQTILLLPTGVALVFTATASKIRFAEYAPAFKKLISSFSLRKAAPPPRQRT